MSARAWLYRQLAPEARSRGLSSLNQLIVWLIVLASLSAILSTEPTIAAPYASAFVVLELGFGTAFLLEYLARLWIAPETPGAGSAWRSRLRFVLSPSGLIDIITVIASFAPGAHAAWLMRAFRLLRILRLAKLGRMSNAWSHIAVAVHSRRAELYLSLFAGLGLMVISATLLYLAEGDIQPDKFGSIPRALWWSVATLTTIGYGDVFPVTPLGKVLAAITALTSIGLIALPTGILAAAFSDALQRHRASAEEHAE